MYVKRTMVPHRKFPAENHLRKSEKYLGQNTEELEVELKRVLCFSPRNKASILNKLKKTYTKIPSAPPLKLESKKAAWPAAGAAD